VRRTRARAALGAAAAVLLLRLGASPPPVAAPTSPPLPPLSVGVAGRAAPRTGAAFPGDACASPRLPALGELPALLGPHPATRVLSDGVRRVVVARGLGEGADTRLVVVGPVARAARLGGGAGGGAVSVASEARVTYHGDVAHLCGAGAAYVRDRAGRFGPGTQGLHLDMEVDGVTLLAQADLWTASAAYHVVGRLVTVPIPDATLATSVGALTSPLARHTGGEAAGRPDRRRAAGGCGHWAGQGHGCPSGSV